MSFLRRNKKRLQEISLQQVLKEEPNFYQFPISSNEQETQEFSLFKVFLKCFAPIKSLAKGTNHFLRVPCFGFIRLATK